MAVIVNGDGTLTGVSNLATDLTDITSGRGTITGVTTVGTLQLGAGVSISSPRTQQAAIFTNNTEFLTVDDAGRVGVGTITPNSDAHPENEKKINVGFITAKSIAGDIDARNVVVAGVSTFVGAIGDVTVSTLTSTGTVSIADSIVHTGDTNTSLRFPSADTITAETAGSERFRIDSSGNIGVNNASPSYILSVNGDTGINVTASSNSTEGVLSVVGRNSGGSVSAISRLKSYPDGSSNQSHFTIETRNSSNTMVERFRIKSDGSVGIGTNNPQRILQITDNVPTIRFTDANSTGTPDSEIGGAGGNVALSADLNNEKDDSAISFLVDGSEKVVIDSSGHAILKTANAAFKSESSSSGDWVRMYAGAGTGKWDIYGNGANLRFSDNDSAGNVAFDRPVIVGSTVVDHTLGVLAANSATPAFGIQNPANDENINFSTYHDTNGIYVRIGANAKFDANGNGAVDTTDHKSAAIDIDARNHGRISFLAGGTGGAPSTRATIENNGNLTISDGNLVIGTSGHGIDFSATSNAGGMASELFDHYEEGTWTPGFYPMSSAMTISYDLQTGHYRRIGNVVFWAFRVRLSALSGQMGQNMGFSGFPYNIDSSQPQFSANIYGSSYSGETPTGIFYDGAVNRGTLYYHKNDGQNALTAADLNPSNSYTTGTGFYFAA